MAKITIEQAQKIIEVATAKQKAEKWNPLTIAVLDDGGHLKAFVRPDGPGGPLRPHIAIGKAWGAVAFGMSSRALESRFNQRPHFLNALVNVSNAVGPGMIPVPETHRRTERRSYFFSASGTANIAAYIVGTEKKSVGWKRVMVSKRAAGVGRPGKSTVLAPTL